MILQLENGEKVRVRVVKKGEIYEYFIKDKKIGVYVHIPFCKQKCYYCDFISYCNKDNLIED